MPTIMAKVQSLAYIFFHLHSILEAVIAFSLTFAGCFLLLFMLVDTFYQELPGIELIAIKLSLAQDLLTLYLENRPGLSDVKTRISEKCLSPCARLNRGNIRGVFHSMSEC